MLKSVCYLIKVEIIEVHIKVKFDDELTLSIQITLLFNYKIIRFCLPSLELLAFSELIWEELLNGLCCSASWVLLSTQL